MIKSMHYKLLNMLNNDLLIFDVNFVTEKLLKSGESSWFWYIYAFPFNWGGGNVFFFNLEIYLRLFYLYGHFYHCANC